MPASSSSLMTASWLFVGSMWTIGSQPTVSQILEFVVKIPTQSLPTNMEGVQPQLLEGFQVPPQVLDSIISQRVASRGFVSPEILVDHAFHQELRPPDEVNRSTIHPQDRLRQDESTYSNGPLPKIPSLDVDGPNGSVHLGRVYAATLLTSAVVVEGKGT